MTITVNETKRVIKVIKKPNKVTVSRRGAPGLTGPPGVVFASAPLIYDEETQSLSIDLSDIVSQDELDQEAAARINADGTLATSLADETTRAILAESTKATAIALADEVSRASAVEAGLSDAIDSEMARALEVEALKADLVDDGTGTLVVPTSQIPSGVTRFHIFDNVNSEAAMLALTNVHPGDVAIRTDLGGRRFWLIVAPASNVANWRQIDVDPSAAVDTVNGQIGNVTLGYGDVGADPAGAAATAEANATTKVNAAVLAAANDATTKMNTALASANSYTDNSVSTSAATLVPQAWLAQQTAGAITGVATLDASGLLLTSQRPYATNVPLGLSSVATKGAGSGFAQEGHIHPSTMTAVSPSDIAMIITGAASQSGSLLSARNSALASMMDLGPTGTLSIAGTANVVGLNSTWYVSGTSLNATQTDPSGTVLFARGAASQSANLLSLQNSSGTNMFTVNPSGTITAAAFLNGANSSITNALTTRTLIATGTAVSDVPITTKVAASASSRAFRVLNSSSTELFAISQFGEPLIPGNVPLTFLQDNSTGGSVGFDPSMVKFGTLGRAQSFAGANSVFIERNAYFDGGSWKGVDAGYSATYLAIGSSTAATNNGSVTISFAANPATNGAAITPVQMWAAQQSGSISHAVLSNVVGYAIKLSSGASADALQVQNSASAVLASISAAGVFTASSLRIGASAVTPSDGQLRLGSNTPSIYFDRLGTQEWLFYDSGATLFVRDILNSRMQVTYTSGAVGAAKTDFADRVRILLGAAQASNGIEIIDSTNNTLFTVAPTGSTVWAAVPATVGGVEVSSPSLLLQTSRWTGTANAVEANRIQAVRQGGVGAVNAVATTFKHADGTTSLVAGPGGRASVGDSAKFLPVNNAVQWTVGLDSASNIGQVIKLAASASSDALQIQNSSSAVLASISVTGAMTATSYVNVADNLLSGSGTDQSQIKIGTMGRIQSFPTTTGTYFANGMYYDGTSWIGLSASSQPANFMIGQGGFILQSASAVTAGTVASPVSTFAVTPSGAVSNKLFSTNVVGITTTLAASATADAYQLKNSANTTIAGISAAGRIWSGSTGPLANATHSLVGAGSTGNTVLTLRAVSGVTAPMLQLQTSAAAVVANIFADGGVTSGPSIVGTTGAVGPRLELATTTTAPASNPVGGAIIYVDSNGHLQARTPNGLTQIAA